MNPGTAAVRTFRCADAGKSFTRFLPMITSGLSIPSPLRSRRFAARICRSSFRIMVYAGIASMSVVSNFSNCSLSRAFATTAGAARDTLRMSVR